MAFAASQACFCCCCLTSCIARTILTILALFGITLLFFFAATNPQKMKVLITEASITRFDFIEANGTVLHNLVFNMSIRNPNRIVGFYYNDFTTRAFHQGIYVDGDWTRFYQGPKNTTAMRFGFVGKHELYLEDGSDKAKRIRAGLEAEKRVGVFDIDVDVELLVRARVGRVRVGIFQPKIRRCGLKVPFVSAERRKSGETGFNVTECGVRFKVGSLLEPLD